ncbi:LysR family transcriptional regulator ArgP [Rhodobacter lacus]|uniref:LysR family transcriptional regulator ArgP n=1 Tax=Rhodobacter lacus TaxID=1641972 RepID=A0ABW5A9H3_9RHOB
MFDYPLLAALAAVLREGSFERAARGLGITPSAVSQRIRTLEERVGATLVVRSQPPVATEAGARLCAHLERVRLLESELAADLPGLGGPEAGPATLNVAVNADSLGSWFLPAVVRFAEATGALVHLTREDEEHTAQRLRRGEVLAALTTDPAPLPGCRTRPLGALRYAACASPAFLRRHFAQGVTPQALARAPVLQFDAHDGLQARWLRDAFTLPLTAPSHRVPSTQGFLEACAAGLGWALQPLPLATGLIESGALIALMPGQYLDVPLHWQHVRLGSPLLEALTKEVVAQARARLIALR